MFPLLVALAVVVAGVLIQRFLHYALMRMKRLAGRKLSGEAMMDVVFLHPDLGLGGAERLVVDAVVGLQSQQEVHKKIRCTMVTNHHEPQRAFQETRDGTIKVVVHGSWIPRHIAHRGLVLCATMRMIFAAVVTCIQSPRTDVFIVDQVSAAVPVLKLLCPSSAVLFYCHFPDQLCDPSRAKNRQRSLLHRTYRNVFDAIEAFTMRFSDSIVCNSKFSRGVTVDTFPSLASKIHSEEDIFYPPINIASATAKPLPPRHGEAVSVNPFENLDDAELSRLFLKHRCCFVSLNRYERKKNIALALEAFATLIGRLKSTATTATTDALVSADDLLLVVAGGYDPRLAENVDHYTELVTLSNTLGIEKHCVFLRSIESSTKHLLLSRAQCIVYTPSGEHFGIVPIEAMAFGKVVLAVNDGGPMESVTNTDRYGFLRPPQPAAFAEVMSMVAHDVNGTLVRRIGAAAKARCQEQFSLNSFSTRLMQRLLLLRSNVTDKKLGLGTYSIKKMVSKQE
ncbi:glycosyltransferase ALG2, putative [Bodo saltans]|uniref:Alpha-1,3/1,6-mannosyltransferase ALG2 n=1 Tax=Bodo saltans TaxID=75058 RepID=A0A0S4INF7_BODSA|nr:glycosyltransferase ALG2, putative [Bodo saltans]|eukprot:CUE86750.1 glycosyltransferase ALG2, putative [Bodo saltans]